MFSYNLASIEVKSRINSIAAIYGLVVFGFSLRPYFTFMQIEVSINLFFIIIYFLKTYITNLQIQILYKEILYKGL